MKSVADVKVGYMYQTEQYVGDLIVQTRHGTIAVNLHLAAEPVLERTHRPDLWHYFLVGDL